MLCEGLIFLSGHSRRKYSVPGCRFFAVTYSTNMQRSWIRRASSSLLLPVAIAVLSVILTYMAAATTYQSSVVPCDVARTQIEQLVCLLSHPSRGKVKLNSVYPFS